MRTRQKLSGGLMIIAVNLIFLMSVSAFFMTAPDLSVEDVFAEQNFEPERHAPDVTEKEPEPAGKEPDANKQSDPAATGNTRPVKKTTVKASGGSILLGGSALSNKSGISLDFNALMAEPPALQARQQGPEVLIVHTHATESFMPDGAESYEVKGYSARSTDNSNNMVEVGRAFAAQLQMDGISVLQDDTQNDYPEYNGAYTRAEKVIAWYLKKYPTIRVVLDLHRDSLTAADGVKYKALAGEPGVAQVMVVAGSAAGGLTHKNYKQNLRLAVLWQQQMDSDYKQLTRPVDFVKYRYNQHMTAGSLILEIGTDANSLSEAKEAAFRSAAALAKVLKQIP